jgi:large subunit ribosomal protein L30
LDSKVGKTVRTTDMANRIKITYSKSAIGYDKSQRATIKALGFRRLNQSVEHDDTPVIRGMVGKVHHLVTVEEVD